MNSTVVGRAKLTVLATVDVRPTSLAMQFITLSVHLCVQHDAREAPRRSGSSATADPVLESHPIATVVCVEIRTAKVVHKI